MSAVPTTATGRDLACGGGRLRLCELGAGPPLLLLHGWALDLAQWSPQLAALARDHRVLCIDRPGFGQSSGPAGLRADVGAIGCVIGELDLGPVVLVASSQAARAALAFALESPAALRALVLDGAPLEGFLPEARPEDAAPVAALAALLDYAGLAAVRSALAAHPLFALRNPDPAVRALLAGMLGRYAATDLANPPAGPETNMAARLAGIAVPALVLNGEHDTAHRRLTGEALAYGLPRATRRVLAGAGHLANLDQPAAWTRAVLDFLNPLTPER